MSVRNGNESPEWLNPSTEQHALQRYVSTIRERLPLIVLTTLLALGAAIAYVALAPKTYEAESNLLITPVGRDDEALSGLSILRDSSDPTRDVQTAARLVTTRGVATEVRERLRLDESVDALLDKVTAEPVAQSNIVAVTAQGDSPEKARNTANAFAEASVQERTERLHSQLDNAIANLRTRLRDPGVDPDSSEQIAIRSQLARLETLRSGEDPTMRVEAPAALPDGASAPKPALSILAGLLAGLVLGIGGAFALQVLDPRLRREEQLRALYRLPILARIPRETKRMRRGGEGARAPEELSPSTLEAYRSLRATLTAYQGGAGGRSILVTSASPSEGKSTTAINLASSLALVGHRVVLIEADLRRPAVGKALGVESTVHGTDAVLLGTVPLREALIQARAYGESLQLLLAEDSGAASAFMADQLFLPAAERLVSEAKELADYVIIDSPPLSEVIDALPLAQRVDDVLLVVRLGRTQLPRLARVAEVLGRHGVQPAGFAVVGVPSSGEYGYYYTPRPEGRKAKSARSKERTAAL